MIKTREFHPVISSLLTTALNTCISFFENCCPDIETLIPGGAVMYNTNENIYETVYNIVLNSGSVHEQKTFSTNVLNTLATVCPFDQARIYFYNGNGRIYDQYLIGADPKWANAYHEYYSKIQNGRYSTKPECNENMRPHAQRVKIKNWEGDEIINNEFYQDYVRPQQIKSSIGFAFFDTTGSTRAVFMLDRTSSAMFSDYELRLMSLAYPQLNNMHKKILQ